MKFAEFVLWNGGTKIEFQPNYAHRIKAVKSFDELLRSSFSKEFVRQRALRCNITILRISFRQTFAVSHLWPNHLRHKVFNSINADSWKPFAKVTDKVIASNLVTLTPIPTLRYFSLFLISFDSVRWQLPPLKASNGFQRKNEDERRKKSRIFGISHGFCSFRPLSGIGTQF